MTEPPLRARLIADAGAASADPASFFRSPEFLAAEGATHARDRGGTEPLLPVIEREIESESGRDAASPYGYPGAASLPDPVPDPAQVDWSGTGLTSLFIRDRIGDAPALAGGTMRAEVHIADPRREGGMRKRLREQIRRNERRGWRVAAEPGADAEPTDRAAFERAYAETMARAGASARYLYPPGISSGCSLPSPPGCCWRGGRARARRRRDRGAQRRLSALLPGRHPTPPSRTRQ